MATVGVVGGRAPAWRGGFGRLWSAAVISRFGDALRTTLADALKAGQTAADREMRKGGYYK